MAYPDDHVALTTMFGASATYSTSTGVLSIDVSELPDVDTISSITNTGIVLALVRAIKNNQGSDTERKIEVGDTSSALTNRGSISSLRERYQLDFYHSFSSTHDPDSI